MRQRNAARLLVINSERQVLLFRFQHKDGALAGRDYWATPGGGLEDGETFEAAAVRELFEETGMQVNALEASVAQDCFAMMLPSGETVMAVEQYFVVHAEREQLTRNGWTAEEVQVMTEHKWWSIAELEQTTEIVWPQSLIDMLDKA
ncbi:NUDIX hydrolase [Pseudomonas umsongensis]|uniref:NUDIX hydrolase n=1 Tax=Pseudomonas umsongensis TaxID=198618 RepID=UPI003D7F8233